MSYFKTANNLRFALPVKNRPWPLSFLWRGGAMMKRRRMVYSESTVHYWYLNACRPVSRQISSKYNGTTVVLGINDTFNFQPRFATTRTMRRRSRVPLKPKGQWCKGWDRDKKLNQARWEYCCLVDPTCSKEVLAPPK